MHPTIALWFLPVLLLTGQVRGREDDNYDPELNLHPRNITDLDYFYYPWIGSYYNGTIIFTVSDIMYRESFNDDDEELCPALQNMTHSFSWPGLLAITQIEGEDERPENTNPVNVILSASYSNFTKYFSTASDSNMAIRDQPWGFESIEPSRYAYSEKGEPNFNLSVSDSSSPPFTVLGTSDIDDDNPLGAIEIMKMRSCHEVSDVEWGVSFAPEDWDDDGLGVTNPTFELSFDGNSANIAIYSWAFMNTGDDDQTPQVAAKVKIDFLGSIDPARSDILDEGSPITWTRTVGFGNNSLNLDSETSAAMSLRIREVNLGVFWGLLGVSVACFVYF